MSSRSDVVAIDGPAGSGKSTVARGVADALGVEVLDTGAMYRAATLAVLEAGVDPGDADAVAAVAHATDIAVGEPPGRVLLGGRDVTTEIRGPEVTAAVSAVSAHPAVREVMVGRQREWVDRHRGGVVEGRDIGTVVFPDAAVKVFLTASDEERARRRQRDEEAAARDAELAHVREALAHRDALDSGRTTSPLRPAGDALVVDTTGRSVDDVVAEIVGRFRSVGPNGPSSGEGGRGRGVSAPPSDRGKRIAYRIVHAILLSALKVIFRVRIRGREKVPRRGAYVVAPSHRSLIDTFLAAFITKRRIRFMGKAELFKKRWLAWLLTAFGAFPVERGAADRAALRAARAGLEGGEPVAIYPEGTRRQGPEIFPLFDGACYLAARLGVPVVPVAIAGSEQILPSGKWLPRLHRVVIVIGDPLEPPRRDGRVRRQDVVQMTEQLRVELQKRFDDALAIAGVPGRTVPSASEVGQHE